MLIKKKWTACAAALALPLSGCGVLATNGLDYSSYPIPTLPAAAPAPAPPAPPPCQMPEAGQSVSLAGCKTGDTLVLRGVNFEFNKATLTVNAKTLLDQVASALAERPDIKVEIDGHTDGKGSAPYNQQLSEQRAASVKTYLATHGVEASRLSTRGFGKTMPIADNGTDEGRELNRRVELKVLESAPPPLAFEAAPAPAATAAAKNSAIVVLEPLAAHANEPGAGIPTSIGVLTHVPNPVEAGPTLDYKNQPPLTPDAPKAGPAWVNHTGGNTYAEPSAKAPPSPPVASVSGSDVTIANYSFTPATLTVAAGTTVTWTNKDQATHTVKFPSGDQTLEPGASFSLRFDRPGSYAYQCGRHAAMHGTIVVN